MIVGILAAVVHLSKADPLFKADPADILDYALAAYNDNLTDALAAAEARGPERGWRAHRTGSKRR